MEEYRDGIEKADSAVNTKLIEYASYSRRTLI